jgi:hypothetical protein
MRLSTTAVSILRGNKDIWKGVMAALGVKRDTMYKYVRENSEELTKASALQVLKRKTGLTDSELLEEERESIGATK